MSDSRFRTAEIAEHPQLIGVSSYRIAAGRLHKRLRGSLPTVEQLEAELGKPDREDLT